ncbi:hypothetical protein GCK32_015778 [Trichostrongylus colubriformis]|uniref:Uncharacterized protein n=1 Tax=Trichostrongylus colubriformis TaxID=6319 RepID=A0AAN8FZ67_TRICO
MKKEAEKKEAEELVCNPYSLVTVSSFHSYHRNLSLLY